MKIRSLIYKRLSFKNIVTQSSSVFSSNRNTFLLGGQNTLFNRYSVISEVSNFNLDRNVRSAIRIVEDNYLSIEISDKSDYIWYGSSVDFLIGEYLDSLVFPNNLYFLQSINTLQQTNSLNRERVIPEFISFDSNKIKKAYGHSNRTISKKDFLSIANRAGYLWIKLMVFNIHEVISIVKSEVFKGVVILEFIEPIERVDYDLLVSAFSLTDTVGLNINMMNE